MTYLIGPSPVTTIDVVARMAEVEAKMLVLRDFLARHAEDPLSKWSEYEGYVSLSESVNKLVKSVAELNGKHLQNLVR